ncbi:MAG: hypothetical protein LBP55_05665 [Candidatus Adiutrix sp.]|jgi:hypothetical protein|nr:hypothetical protein [Candidatus Adiutrix sp.]
MKNIIATLLFLSLSWPALAPAAELAGIYVQCPPKDEEVCPQTAQEFRRLFPHGQTSPYLMLRKDGQGYLAPDDQATVKFTWEALTGDTLLFTISGQKKTREEYQVSGGRLVNAKTGASYLLTLTDAEWNEEPVPYKEKKKAQEKAEKEAVAAAKKAEKEALAAAKKAEKEAAAAARQQPQ